VSDTAKKRFPETSDENLRARMAARKRRRAKNKMRRDSKNKLRQVERNK